MTVESEVGPTLQNKKGSGISGEATESAQQQSPSSSQQTGLNRQVSSLIVAVSVLTLILGGTILFYIKQDLLKAEGNTLAITAGELGLMLDLILLERYGDIRGLSELPELLDGNLKAIMLYLERMQTAKEGSFGFVVTDDHGHIVASTEPTWIGQSYDAHPLFQAVKKLKAIQVQDVQPLDNTNDDLTIMYGAPLSGSSNEFSGAVFFQVHMSFLEKEIHRFVSTFKNQYEEEGKEDTFEWQLLNKHGLVLLDSVLREQGQVNLIEMRLPSALAASTKQHGYLEEQHLRRHVPVITGYGHTSTSNHTQDLGWSILLRRDKASILASINNTIWSLAGIGIVILLPLLTLLLKNAYRLQKILLQTQETERAISRLNRRNELLLNSAGEGIYGVDTDGKTTFVNPAAAKALGYEPEELIGIPMHARVHHTKSDGSPYPQEECPISTTFRDGSVQRIGDEVLWRKNGTSFPVEYTSTPILDEKGTIEGAVITFMDVTERKKAEKKFRHVFESAPSGMVMINQQGTIVLANQLISHHFGYTREELHGQKIEMLIPDRFRPQHPDHRMNFFANPHPRTMGGGRELYGLRKDGSEFPVEIGLNPLNTEEGMFVLASVNDITERKQADHILREREARFSLVVEASPNSMVMMDRNGHILMVNSQTERMFGYSKKEITGQPIERLIPERFRFIHAMHRERFVANPTATRMAQGRELPALHKNGTEFPVEVGLNAVQTPDGLMVIATIVDMTKLKKSQKAIEQLSRQNQLILESAGEGIYGLDTHGLVTFVNPAGAKMLGYEPEELIGAPMHATVHHTKSDGSPYPQEECPITTTFRYGSVQHIEDEVLWRKDGTSFPVEYTSTPIHEEQSRLAGAVIMFKDITDRIQAKQALETRNAELARSNQELDDFAYIASHDLKEPLRGINNYATILVEDYSQTMEEEALARCNTMIRLCQRMEELINSLHYFSRVGRTELAMMPTNLQSVLEDVLESLDIRLKECGVLISTPQPLPTVYCDSARVGEIFRNLITNAMKYNDKEEKWIEIGYINENSTESPFDSIPETIPTFYVRDNGIGIREKHFTTIFGIFRRLHGRNKFGGGTGSGLTITKKLVERHGGTLWVESTFGEGTTFFFTLQGRCGHAINASTANSLS